MYIDPDCKRVPSALNVTKDENLERKSLAFLTPHSKFAALKASGNEYEWCVGRRGTDVPKNLIRFATL